MELKDLEPKFKKIISNFTEQLKLRLKNNLKSVILYGSLASGQHSRRHSDINILVLLYTVDLESLRNIALIKRNLRFRKIMPLAFDENYIKNSTDTFPIEFLDMREKHIVLWGEDCLKDIRIETANLRHQCEWELKSKIIKMQQFYINSRGKDRALKHLLLNSLPSLFVIFKNILRLKHTALEGNNIILDEMVKNFGIDKTIFYNLLEARAGNYKITDTQKTFSRILTELVRLAGAVDNL